MIANETATRTEVNSQINLLVDEFMVKLKDENRNLYRKKADINEIIGGVAIHVTDKSVKINIINQLAEQWTDGDGDVRSVCIKRTQDLMNQVDDVDMKKQMLQRVCRLLNDKEYSEKEELHEMLVAVGA